MQRSIVTLPYLCEIQGYSSIFDKSIEHRFERIEFLNVTSSIVIARTFNLIIELKIIVSENF